MNKENNNTPMIEIKDLVIDYGEAIAVNKSNVKIEKGELVTLLGPSGCGKSTTLNAVAGLITATSGKIYFEGKNVTKLSPKERNIGLVFQSYALYPHMSVYKNIAFPLESSIEFKREIINHNRNIDNEISKLKFIKAGGTEKEFKSYIDAIEQNIEFKNEHNDKIKLINFKADSVLQNAKEAINVAELHTKSQIKKASKLSLEKLNTLDREKKEAKKDLKIINNQIKSNSNDAKLIKAKESLLKMIESFGAKEEKIINEYDSSLSKIKESGLKEKEFATSERTRIISEVTAWRKEQISIENEKFNSKKEEMELNSKEAKEQISIVMKNFVSTNEIKEEISNLNKTKKYLDSEVDKRVREVAEKVGITNHLKKKPSNMSGGQQQRVAISRALVKNPNILLLDEPLSNLDAKMRVSTRQWIRNLQQSLGITTLFVTHDQEEAMSISDRIICMSEGFIQQVDEPMNMYHNPANKFVAGFLGMPEMNFFVKGKIADELRSKLKFEKDVTFGIRPEHVRMVEEKRDGEVSLLKLKGKVTLAESLGRERLITAEFNGEVIRLFVENTKIDIGDDIEVMIRKGKLYAFEGKQQTTKGRY